MPDLKQLQKRIYDNKVDKGFNVTDVEKEFCFIYEELAEAWNAYNKKLPDVGEELADVAIYLLGLAQILGIDLGEEIDKKVEKNEKREFKKENGVFVKIKNE